MAEETADDKPTLTGLARRLGQLPADKKRSRSRGQCGPRRHIAAGQPRVCRGRSQGGQDTLGRRSSELGRAWPASGYGKCRVGRQVFCGRRFGVEERARGRRVRPSFRSAFANWCFRARSRLGPTALSQRSRPGSRPNTFSTGCSRWPSRSPTVPPSTVPSFSRTTPAVARAISRFGEDRRPVAESVLALVAEFATRTGGMTADLWAGLAGFAGKARGTRGDRSDAAVCRVSRVWRQCHSAFCFLGQRGIVLRSVGL